MSFSELLPAHRDPVTGVRVVRISREAAPCHLAAPAFSPGTADGRFVVYVSHDGGNPDLYCADVLAGDSLRLTDRPDLDPFSGVLTRDGMAVLYTGDAGLFAVTVPDGDETLLASFEGSRALAVAPSPDGRKAAVGVLSGARGRIVEVDLFSGDRRTLLERAGMVGAMAYSPDGERILYSGGAGSRVRAVGRDGTGDRPLCRQDAGEWVTDAAWLDRETAVFVRFHDGLYEVGDGTEPRALFKGPVWHVATGPGLVVCDTRSPDIGLVLLSPSTGRWRRLCLPLSSNRGFRWQDPLPQGEETLEVSRLSTAGRALPAETEYGPEWTHPHPAFSRDGNGIFFTSDLTGTAQVYAVRVPPEWLGELKAEPSGAGLPSQ